MADRFAKQPANIRGGTSVKVDVKFDWYGGKNRHIKSDIQCPSYVSPVQQEIDGKLYKTMEEYAKAFWAKKVKG